ncbi:hypothetical protein [Hymenobacter glaciei]
MLLPIGMLTSCTNSENPKIAEKATIQKHVNADSIQLTTLIRDIYEWHETKHRNVGFPFKGNFPSDSVFTGIDWDAYNKESEIFRQTNYFSQEFLNRHRAIATTIDSSVKKASVEWRNFNDGIPLWSTDADDWCGCQDSPDEYWKQLSISNLKLSNNNTAVFNWAWGIKDGVEPPFTYKMKAKKENGVWRISYMDGFSHYGTVADYDKTMSQSKK